MDCDAIRDDMLDVLYGEGGDGAARRVEAHHAVCAECRGEMAALRRLRGQLAHWPVPEALRPAPAVVAAPRRWPVGLAAAAGLIVALGAALGLSGAEMRYERAGLSIRLGRRPAPESTPDTGTRAELATLRAEVAALRAADDRPTLGTVADMIRESESRQDQARAASLREIRERADSQRQYDLARVSAGLAYLDGKAGLQEARTTELVGHLLQASQR